MQINQCFRLNNFGLDFAVITLRAQLKQSIGYPTSEYMMYTAVTVTAFALSLFRQVCSLCEQREKVTFQGYEVIKKGTKERQ